jgi:SAM-dependent methyltransferase
MTEEDFYADRGRLAIYLEIEWSDYLYGRSSKISSPPNPSTIIVPPYFHIELSKYITRWGNGSRSYLEVGGGTGRLVYEVAQSLGSLENFCFVEPSQNFFSWAKRILTCNENLPAFPRVDSNADAQPVQRPPVVSKLRDSMLMLNQTLEELDPNLGTYDLVVSCNVLDRHPDPREFANILGRYVSPGGLFVLATPFDFHDEITPSEKQFCDLKDLLTAESWAILEEMELPYSWRKWSRPRTWVGFSCQVLAARRLDNNII